MADKFTASKSQLKPDHRANSILASDNELFREEPPVRRSPTDGSLNVKVMVNFAAQHASSATLRPLDTSALVSILRSISREPRICKFSIVAFNMTEQRVLYRQDNADQIDFPALGVRANLPARTVWSRPAKGRVDGCNRSGR